jgi:hypothetical protein
MEGEKLESAQAALRVFLSQIITDQERVGLVEFNSGIANIVELDTLENNRETLSTEVEGLVASGNTALLDAIATAYARLWRLDDQERINAVVVMTDGRENASQMSTEELVRGIQEANQENRIAIFAVAYGDDADYETLEEVARASGGQVREGSPETIDLRRDPSSYFVILDKPKIRRSATKILARGRIKIASERCWAPCCGMLSFAESALIIGGTILLTVPVKPFLAGPFGRGYRRTGEAAVIILP